MQVNLNNTIISISFLFILLSCYQNKTKPINMIEKHTNSTQKKAELYGIEFNINSPSEIRVNDLIISKKYMSGITGPEIINQYIRESGEQKVKIQIIHPYGDQGGLFNNEALQSLIQGTYIQTIDKENNYEIKVVKDLKLPNVDNETAIFEYEWVFNANVPYKISSWEDAENLEDIDKKELEEEVLNKYQELWSMLEMGDVELFMNEIKESNEDLFMSNYFDENKQIEYLNNLRNFYKNHKGTMTPIKEFKMVFLANGKGVALEQTGKFRGFGVLMAKGAAQNSLFTNYVTLIKSKKKNAFKIQLINSEYLKYD